DHGLHVEEYVPWCCIDHRDRHKPGTDHQHDSLTPLLVTDPSQPRVDSRAAWLDATMVCSRSKLRLRTRSASATLSRDARRFLSMYLNVKKAIRRSVHSEALRTYHSSNISLSSLVTSLAPFTWAQPVMPGRTESLVDVFEG